MPYTISTDIRDDHLYVHVTGTRTLQGAQGVVRDSVEAAREASLDRILIDMRDFQGSLSVGEGWSVINKDLNRYRPHARQKVALLDMPSEQDRLRTFELIAANRGFNLRVFSEEAKAIAWLLV